MTSKNFKVLHVRDTKFGADSVEWCPISPYKNYFVCGTYCLCETTRPDLGGTREGENKRIGSVALFRVAKNNLEEVDRVECSAVLDMKWASRTVNGNLALATANADGEVNLFYLEDGFLKLVTKCVLKKDFGDYLILSVDWVKTPNPDLICSSDSQGNVTLIKVTSNDLQVFRKWKAHSLEAWIVCFDSFNPNNLYSGGDEAEMKVWDGRCEDIQKVASSTKHTAGVTALNSNVFKENSLVSGSYDETVLFWDARSWKASVGCISASGGLWRLKWEPLNRSRYLLAACIYGGFQIYDVNSYLVVADHKEHESLAYGADWCFLSKAELKNLLDCQVSALIGTCSFYDHKLCVSSWSDSLDLQ